MILRAYQEEGLQGMRENLRSHRSVLYVLPCGGGKGSVTTYIVRAAVARGLKVIFAVRGLALVNDMSRRLNRLELPHGILRGGVRRDLAHPVQVASVNTLFGMDEPPPADLIILDEARTFSNDSGRKILERYPKALIVGLDATPVLITGKGLGVQVGGYFESIVTGPEEQQLIDMGFLCRSVPIGTGEPPDVSSVKMLGGDFDPEQLEAACNKPKLVGDIVAHWKREAAGLKTVAFGVTCAHARSIRDAFVAEGIEWEYVDGETPDKEREAIYGRLDNGTLMGIANVGIAGVGWDHPVISCIISAQPTVSLSRWRQQLGRGSRVFPGKTHFVVLDHAGNTIRHWPYGFFETPPAWSLEGIRKQRGKSAAAGEPVSMCKRPVRIGLAGVPTTFSGPVSEDGTHMLPCFCYFPTGPTACPRCGLPLLPSERGKIETEAGELRDLSDLKAAAKSARNGAESAHDIKMRNRYLELVREGLQRRKRNGDPYSFSWPTITFRLEFNRFPKKALLDEGVKLREALLP